MPVPDPVGEPASVGSGQQGNGTATATATPTPTDTPTATPAATPAEPGPTTSPVGNATARNRTSTGLSVWEWALMLLGAGGVVILGDVGLSPAVDSLRR